VSAGLDPPVGGNPRNFTASKRLRLDTHRHPFIIWRHADTGKDSILQQFERTVLPEQLGRPTTRDGLGENFPYYGVPA